MTTTRKLLGAVSALALVSMSSAPALAAGTSAGDLITNNVSVSFEVGNIAQNAVTASDTFTVDQRVDVSVAFIGSTVSVSPGETQAELAFDVTNLSNATVDLSLAQALTAGTSANISNIAIYIDSDGDRTLSTTELAAGPVTYLDEVGEDVTVALIIVGDISTSASDGDTFDLALTADAHAGGGAGSLGAELTGSTGANTAGIDTVLFDGSGDTDAPNDGAFSDTGDFLVSGAQVAVAKTSSVISDPVNGTTNPKAIPGATVQYCITVSNAAGAATATAVNVVDDLPADVTYLTSFGIFVDGDASCANGSSGGSFSAGTGPGGLDQILAGLSDISESTTRSVYFQVTIN